MPDLKIYGVARSRAFRVLWAAKELGLEYDHVQIGFDGSNKTPEFLAVNPLGSVPVIADGDFKLFESLAINMYLAKRAGSTLYPAALEDEARTWQWSLFGATELDFPILDWARNTTVLPPEKRDPAVAAKALATLAPKLAALDKALAGRSYLLGEQFTVADLNLASVMYRLLWADLGATPAVKGWLDRCYDRPAAKEARAMRE
ncbi:glutathione S-transferase [Stella humosa]|uniref:Glutathione S-transferase n=1 Tax=Stella humosa TaxID=94 RepID=A0A3N1M2R2_9PROT|nr:glutathione S-transferase family protein [Stella humosa]ROQ01824.1 glutathione S-transferase [Stella humosa]BBK32211.1 glutathione S-transferase [Stella humosa]